MLDQPTECPDAVYRLMKEVSHSQMASPCSSPSSSSFQCWQLQPEDRLPFKSLGDDLKELSERLQYSPTDSDLQCTAVPGQSTADAHAHIAHTGPAVPMRVV